MLRLADPEHAFPHPVTVPVPADDGAVSEPCQAPPGRGVVIFNLDVH